MAAALDAHCQSLEPTRDELHALELLLLGVRCRLETHRPDVKFNVHFSGSTSLQLSLPSDVIEVTLAYDAGHRSNSDVTGSVEPLDISRLFPIPGQTFPECLHHDMEGSFTIRGHFCGADIEFTVLTAEEDSAKQAALQIVHNAFAQHQNMRSVLLVTRNMFSQRGFANTCGAGGRLSSTASALLVASYFQRTFSSCPAAPLSDTLDARLEGYFDFLGSFAFHSRTITPMGPFLDSTRYSQDHASPLSIRLGPSFSNSNVAASVDAETLELITSYAASDSWCEHLAAAIGANGELQLEHPELVSVMRDVSLERIKSSISDFYGYDWDHEDSASDYSSSPVSPGGFYEAAPVYTLGKRARSSSVSLSEHPHKKARNDTDDTYADVESDGESVIELSSETRVFTPADFFDILRAKLAASLPPHLEAEDLEYTMGDDDRVEYYTEEDNHTAEPAPARTSMPPIFGLRLAALERMGLPLATSLARAPVPAPSQVPAKVPVETLPVPLRAPANPSPILGSVENTTPVLNAHVGGDKGKAKSDGNPNEGAERHHGRDEEDILFPTPQSGYVFDENIASPSSSEHLDLDYSFPEDDKVEDAFSRFLAEDAIEVKEASFISKDDKNHAVRSRTVSSNRYGLDMSDVDDDDESDDHASVGKTHRMRAVSSNRYGLDSDDAASYSYDGKDYWAGGVGTNEGRDHDERKGENEDGNKCYDWKAASYENPHKDVRRRAFGTLGSEPLSRTPSLTYPS